MKRDEQDRLLKEIIGGDELSEFRQATLTGALDVIQRRKRRRQAVQLGALVIVPALLVLALFLGPRHHQDVKTANVPAPVTLAIAPPTPEPAPIKTITDEELLALFPNRPVALMGPPGRQQFVFLDQGKQKPSSPRL